MRTVAVTGCSGYLGRKLLEALDTDGVSRVVGIDVREPDFATGNLEFYRMDVRSLVLADVVAGCDALVHLAAFGGRVHAREINVTGTRSVVDACAQGGIRKLIFASTGAVYGAHADNALPLSEESPLRPSEGYAASKAEAESVVRTLGDRDPSVVATILRFAWVCGPSLPPRHAAVVESPVRLAVAGFDPPFQAVHEDDAASALVFALTHDLSGTYNVCADDWIERPDKLLGQARLTLGLSAARRWVERAARLGASPTSDVRALMHPTAMSNDKLGAAGFEFCHSTAEALRSAREAHRGWVSVGPVRFRPRWAAAAGAGIAAMTFGSRVRRGRGA